jgi:hypothetical protein
MPLTVLPQMHEHPMSTLSCNKENQHKKTKVTSSETQLRRRRRRARPAQSGPQASRIAPGVTVAHAAMHHLVRKGRKQCDQRDASPYRPQPARFEPEPMSIEPTAATEASSSPQQEQQQEEQPTKPVASGLKYNFPRFLPHYPMPAIKPEALAVIDEQLRDIPIQFILDDILISLAPVYAYSSLDIHVITSKFF